MDFENGSGHGNTARFAALLGALVLAVSPSAFPVSESFADQDTRSAVGFAYSPHADPAASALVASTAHVSLAATVASVTNVPLVQVGYPPIPGVVLARAKGTGQTTGHIATITVDNNSDQPIELPSELIYIPSDGLHQAYVGRPAPGQIVPPGASMEVRIEGYCSDVRRPPVPEGEDMPPLEDWIVSTGETGPVTISPNDNSLAPGLALIPGTDTPLPRAISADSEPLTAAPLLIAAIQQIERTTVELQESGELQTPFSSNPSREKEAVIQQTFWLFSAELENDPYIKDDFAERLATQYEDQTGVSITAASDEAQERLQQGTDDFWAAFELVGVEAKVISHGQGDDSRQLELNEGQAEAVPDTAEDETGNEAGAVVADEQACGSIAGTVSTNPEKIRKAIRNIVVYVEGECDFCPPKPDRETVVITEDMDGINPPFSVVVKGSPIKLVNGYEKEIDFAPEFVPSPIDQDEQPTHSLKVIRKGGSSEFTPTKSTSGNPNGDYLVKSRWHRRNDARMFVTPNQCYAIADENGHYSIGELPPGDYLLRVYTYVKRTYFTEADVTVEEGKVTVQDFVLDREKKKKAP